ncbi:MAG: hypothetical protein KDA36_06455, partial [Planctomycetaceae bacterium]|nr:hypothetical protein [Planctomycetaceae bacterium]
MNGLPDFDELSSQGFPDSALIEQTRSATSSPAPDADAQVPVPHFDLTRFQQLVDQQTAQTENPTQGQTEEAAVSIPDDPAPETPDTSEPVASSDSSGTHSEPLDFNVQIHVAGINGALQRLPLVKTQTVELLDRKPVSQRWTPLWRSPKTFCLRFPEGFEFIPPKPPKEEKPKAEETPAADAATPEVTKEELL